nr:MAG TPA: hypothetical protein [Caudoviricetes sp.]
MRVTYNCRMNDILAFQLHASYLYIQSKLIQYSLRAFIVLRGIVLSNI